MPKVIRCAQCQTIIATLPDDDPHTFPAPVLCANCTRKKAQEIQSDIQSDIRPRNNDQTASKAGRARALLQEYLPYGAAVTAILANSHLSQNGNRIYEYHLMTTHPERGHIILLNRYLRAAGFGVNRTRGTIRSTEPIYSLIEEISKRIHSDPRALNCTELEVGI